MSTPRSYLAMCSHARLIIDTAKSTGMKVDESNVVDLLADTMPDIALFTVRTIAKKFFPQIDRVTSIDLERAGGKWLAAMRDNLQRRAFRGEYLTWGSHDPVKGLTVYDLEIMAAEIAAAAINNLPEVLSMVEAMKPKVQP